jgi:hypothetical protein
MMSFEKGPIFNVQSKHDKKKKKAELERCCDFFFFFFIFYLEASKKICKGWSSFGLRDGENRAAKFFIWRDLKRYALSIAES